MNMKLKMMYGLHSELQVPEFQSSGSSISTTLGSRGCLLPNVWFEIVQIFPQTFFVRLEHTILFWVSLMSVILSHLTILCRETQQSSLD